MISTTDGATDLLTRRVALVGAAGSGVFVAASTASALNQPGQASLARAIETLRIAMVDGDSNELNRLLDDQLIYMHSSGHSQTKANLLAVLGGKRFFASLSNSDIDVRVVDRTGAVSIMVDQVKNLPNGKTRASRIKVLQTWLLSHGRWVLLARCSALMSSAQIQKCAAPSGPAAL